MVFDLDGTILAEYWHPGYVRTLLSGPCREAGPPITVFSVSNNKLKHAWWNPQALVAFRGVDLAGRGPEPEAWRSGSSHIWYWVIDNINPEETRAKVKRLAWVDHEGDGLLEVRTALSDGRFYFIAEDGEVVSKAVSDSFVHDFGDIPIPDLAPLSEYV